METKSRNQWKKASVAKTSTDRRGMESPETTLYGRFLGDAALRLYTYAGTLSRSPLHQASAQTGYNAPESLLKGEGGGDFEKSLRLQGRQKRAAFLA